MIDNKLCCSIHVPSLLKGMVHLFTRILRGNPSAYCSPEEESRKPSSPKSGPYSPLTSDSGWWRDPEVVPPRSKEIINPTVTEGNICREMEDSIGRIAKISPLSAKCTTIKDCTVFYVKIDGSILNGPVVKVCGSIRNNKG